MSNTRTTARNIVKAESTQQRALRFLGSEGFSLIERREKSEIDEKLRLLVGSWPPLSAIGDATPPV